MHQLKTIIVIPAYNEAATIKELVEHCLPLSLPIIVVDDGSTDNTQAVLEGLPVTLLANEQNSGKAATLWYGMQQAIKAGAEQVISIDGDNATCVCYLQAQHFSQDDTGAHAVLIGGYYSNSLIRTPAGWRIDKYKVVKTWMTTT